MEKIVCYKILDHLHENNTLHRAQHSFLKSCSTCTNLLESFNDWTVCVQSKWQVTVVYIDCQKAFDAVCHRKLFTKLFNYGIRGTVLLWFKTFSPTEPIKPELTLHCLMLQSYYLAWYRAAASAH